MSKFTRNFFIYCITNFIWASVFNLWYSFLPEFYQALGASVLIVGFLFSLERFFEGSSNILGGYLADKFGRKKIIIFGSLIGDISILILFLATHWIWLIPAIAFFWITVGIQSPTIATLISESISRKKRALAFSILSILSFIPAIFAVPIGGWIIEKNGIINGVKISLLLSFFIGVISTLTYVLFLKETIAKVRGKFRLEWRIPKDVLCFVTSYGLLMFAVSLVSPFVIFYSQDVIGIGMVDWGIVVSIFTILTLVVTFLGGMISDKFGRKKVLLLSFLSSLFPILLILSRNLFHIIIAHIFASTIFFVSSSVPAYVFEKTKTARAIGIVNFLITIFMVLGYPLGGFLYSLSPQLPFIISTLIRIIGLIIGIVG
jgi:MFS family permease